LAEFIDSEGLQRSYNVIRSRWDPNFEWVVNETAPWTPLRKPIARSILALVSTCGAYRKGIDCPFDAANFYGDPSFKEIPNATTPEKLDFAHTHYDHNQVSQDPRLAFPQKYLSEFAANGIIGSFADPSLSFSGYLPQPRQLVQDTAPAAAQRLLAAGAEAALLIPC
jgi:D-proline reductase (dithiol) PrdB